MAEAKGGGYEEAWTGSGTPETLPAWRWSRVTLDRDTAGIADVVISGPVWILGNLLLTLANVLWAILLWIMRLALSSGDILGRASYPIDWGFAWLSSHLVAVGAIFLAVALLRIFKKLVNLEWITMLRTILVFVALFAALSYTATQSAKAIREFPDADQQQERLGVVGTMPWVAFTVTDMASKLMAPLSDQVVGMTSQNGMIGGGSTRVAGGGGVEAKVTDPAGPEPADPFNSEGELPVTCNDYIDALQAEYVRAPGSNRTLVVVSNLWVNSFYANWMATQYGAPVSAEENLPARGMCHYAELTNGIPAAEQSEILGTIGVKADPGSKVLDPNAKGADLRRAVTAWVACGYEDGKWITNDTFDGVWNKRLTATDKEGGFSGDQSCQNMFTNPNASWYSGWTLNLLEVETPLGTAGAGISNVDPKDDPYLLFGSSLGAALSPEQSNLSLPGALDNAQSCTPTGVALDGVGECLGGIGDTIGEAVDKVTGNDGKDDPASMDGFDRTQLAPIAAWGEAATGLNHGDRLLYPLLNLVVAALFLFSLGAVAIGLLFSQLLLILCLMFGLPLATAMYALGMPKATQLLRLTASSMLSQVLFTGLLTVMILMTGLFQGLLTAVALPWMFGTILYGLSPLAAFYLIRLMLKRVGMGDLLTASGALSFATSATLRATGDRQLAALGTTGSDGTSAVSRGLGKVPLMGKGIDKFDKKAAPTWANWGPRLSMTTEARRKRADRKAQRKAGTTEKQRKNRENNSFLRERMKSRRPLFKFMNMIDPLLMRDRKGRQQHVGRTLDFLGSKSKRLALSGAGLATYAVVSQFNEGTASRLKDKVRNYARSSSWKAQMNNPLPDIDEVDDPITLLDPGRVTGRDARDASSSSAQNFNSALADARGTDALRDAVMGVLAGAAAAHVGLDAPDVLTPDQEDYLVKQYADRTGYDPSMILSTPIGVIGPRPMSDIERRKASIAHLRDFEHWLPEDERTPLAGESPAEFRARLEVIGRARGGILADGSRVDILAANGIDMSDESTKAELVRFQQGAGNTRFDRLVLAQGSNQETRAAEMAAKSILDSTEQQIRVVAQAVESMARAVNQNIDTLGAASNGLRDVLSNVQSGQRDIEDLERRLAGARERGDDRLVQKLTYALDETQYKLSESLSEGTTELAGTLARQMEAMVVSMAALQYTPEQAKDESDAVAALYEKLMEDYEKLTARAASGLEDSESLRRAGEQLLERIAASSEAALQLAEQARARVRDEEASADERLREMRRRSAQRAKSERRESASDSHRDSRVDEDYLRSEYTD